MAKILQFRLPPAQLHPYYMPEGEIRYETPVKRETEVPPRRKEPIVLSVMPDQPFPVGHQDFRPLLQRDGLILMSWARWEDGYEDGSFVRQYIVTWVTSQGKSRHYATHPILEKELAEAAPERKGDPFFYRGAYGRRFDIRDYSEKDIADYVYLTAPFDLTYKTIPGFIRVLKALGSTVNFDVAYTLTKEREKRSKAREYLNQFESQRV
ncbi:MAG: hypothetical protein LBQ88_10190 [Treponema sp.]|jgi:hypothetical protein|nr:hypothetical protein [Treponema sp.]